MKCRFKTPQVGGGKMSLRYTSRHLTLSSPTLSVCKAFCPQQFFSACHPTSFYCCMAGQHLLTTVVYSFLYCIRVSLQTSLDRCQIFVIFVCVCVCVCPMVYIYIYIYILNRFTVVVFLYINSFVFLTLCIHKSYKLLLYQSCILYTWVMIDLIAIVWSCFSVLQKLTRTASYMLWINISSIVQVEK